MDPLTPTKPALGAVLLVDDEDDVLAFYQDVLRPLGCRMDLAIDGREAASLLATRSYDAVVADIMMPGLDGLALLRLIRESGLDLPVVMVTASVSPQSGAAATAFGAFRYVGKPVEAPALRRAVEYALDWRRMKAAIMTLPETGGRSSSSPGLEETFERAQGALWMAYQPIVSWSKRTVYGYEAFARCEDPVLSTPRKLIDAAERLGVVFQLGRTLRALVASTLDTIPPDTQVFVNLHPRELLDAELYSPHAPLSQRASRVILEVTEHLKVDEIPRIEKRIGALRAMGFRFSVEDLGTGHGGLTTFATVSPEVAKLDQGLVRGADVDPAKRRVLAEMTARCHDLDLIVVSEGVETAAERDAALEAGCDFLQGFLFAQPTIAPRGIRWA